MLENSRLVLLLSFVVVVLVQTGPYWWGTRALDDATDHVVLCSYSSRCASPIDDLEAREQAYVCLEDEHVILVAGTDHSVSRVETAFAE